MREKQESEHKPNVDAIKLKLVKDTTDELDNEDETGNSTTKAASKKKAQTGLIKAAKKQFDKEIKEVAKTADSAVGAADVAGETYTKE